MQMTWTPFVASTAHGRSFFNILLAFDAYFAWYYPLVESACPSAASPERRRARAFDNYAGYWTTITDEKFNGDCKCDKKSWFDLIDEHETCKCGHVHPFVDTTSPQVLRRLFKVQLPTGQPALAQQASA